MQGFGFNWWIRSGGVTGGTPTPTPTPAPSWAVQPSITGTPTEGQTLTGNDGTISNGMVSARSWLRNGSAISGANGGTYLLTSADVGANIAFKVDATGAGGSGSATSASVGPVAAATPTPSPAARNAVRHYMPGYNAIAPGTATGNTAWTVDLVNESGAPMTELSLVLIGWHLSSTGTTAVGNDVPTTAVVTYGGNTTNVTASGSTTITIPNNALVTTDKMTLGYSIPAGATFTVSGTQTLTNGQKYARSGQTGTVLCGLAGVRTHVADGSTLKKESLYSIGDSINTNNSGAVISAALGKCPCVLHSIAGTKLSTYAGANFTKQVALFQALGCTTMTSNLATNDINAVGITYDAVITLIQGFRDAVRAAGGKYVHATVLPYVSSNTETLTSLTSSGTLATAVVPDASKFIVGQAYAIAGANEAEYNTTPVILESRNVGAGTLSWRFAGSASPTATGSITIAGAGHNSSCRALQVPRANFEAGTTSIRAQVNAWIRTPGNVDSVLEWSDAIEVTRNDGLWPRGGDKPELLAEYSGTIIGTAQGAPANPTTTIAYVNITFGSQIGVVGGRITAGSRIGTYVQIASSSNGAIGRVNHVALGSPLVIGDTLTFVDASVRATDDSLHPKAGIPDSVSSTSKGGQLILVNATRTWLDARLA